MFLIVTGHDPDAAGVVSWALRLGGSSNDAGLCVAVDFSGAVVVGGWFRSSTFSTTTATSTSATSRFSNSGGEDAFVVR